MTRVLRTPVSDGSVLQVAVHESVGTTEQMMQYVQLKGLSCLSYSYQFVSALYFTQYAATTTRSSLPAWTVLSIKSIMRKVLTQRYDLCHPLVKYLCAVECGGACSPQVRQAAPCPYERGDK